MIDSIQRKVSDGELKIDQARKQIVAYAEAHRNLEPGARLDESSRGASDQGELSSNRVPGRQSEPGAGGRGGDPGGASVKKKPSKKAGAESGWMSGMRVRKLSER